MNKELKDTLDALTDSYELEIRYLDESIQRVRELHKPVEVGIDYGDNYGDLGCPVCNELYPCSTIKALDGEN